MARKGELRRLLAGGEQIVAPGVFEMFSARIADRMGFAALYMTGYGISASHLGVADAGLVTYSDMVERARTIASGTTTPLIADADTGFGGLLNVDHTVRGYEAAGVQAIQLEDQEMPKRCGHQPGRRVVPLADMLRKIEVALAARSDADMLLIARSDARSGHGIEEALKRGKAFAAAGADVVMLEGLAGEEEFARAGDAIDAPLMANMVPGGSSPMLDPDTLARLGFRVLIYPAAGMAAACAAMHEAYRHLRAHGTTAGSPVPAWDLPAINDIAGFTELRAFEARFAEI